MTRKSRYLGALALCVAVMFAGLVDAQAATKCTAYEQKVVKQIKDGKEFLKQESFRKWIDAGLRSDAPYNKKPYTIYSKWYAKFDDLGGIKAGPQQLAFLEKYGFTASAAYSIIEDYALEGKLTSSVDIDFEQKMNAFPCL